MANETERPTTVRRADVIRDALNDAGYEHARDITDAEACLAYWRAVSDHSMGASGERD